MKKFLASALSAAMLLSLLAGCGGGTTSTPSGSTPSDSSTPSASTPAGDNVIKIGVFEPFTGDSASGGKKEYLGMQYANYETPTVEIGGTEYTVELVLDLV